MSEQATYIQLARWELQQLQTLENRWANGQLAPITLQRAIETALRRLEHTPATSSESARAQEYINSIAAILQRLEATRQP